MRLNESTRPANQEQKRIAVDLPVCVVESFDRQAARLGVTRQSIIKVWLVERLQAEAANKYRYEALRSCVSPSGSCAPLLEESALFEVKATQHVLAVSDPEITEKYFLEKLGFSVRFRVDGWSFLRLGSFHIMLGHCPDQLPARDTHDHSYFAYVNCEDINELHDGYQEQGAEIFQSISDKPWGMREFGVATPDGHRIMVGEELEPVGES